MNFILDIWNGLGILRYFIVIIVIIAIVTIYMSKKQADKINSKAKDWLLKNPDAVKVYLDSKSNLFHSNKLIINSIDYEGEKISFIEPSAMGIYLTPGEHDIEVTFIHGKVNILGMVKKKVYEPRIDVLNVEEGKKYKFYFDVLRKKYILEELN